MRVIVEDTRNQPGKHDNIHEWCEANDVRIVRSKLLVGDYAVPSRQGVCVDTKAGMKEIYGNLVHDHDRIARECDRAHELGIRLVILIEDERIHSIDDVPEWKNPMLDRYEQLKKWHERGRFMGTPLPKKPPVDSARLQRMMVAFAEHHCCEWMFCRRAETGRVLMEVLYGDG